MTGLRIYRGIAAIASIAVLTVGPQVALCNETPQTLSSSSSSSSSSSPKISSRLLNSLKQANPSSSSSSVKALHPPIEDELENELNLDDSSSSSSGSESQRRQLSWWSFALQLHCP
eukprot:CAMPEP_0201630696 /NCGR_PEP_ID=MMETSP0493-20130528/4940_1 /ASSEMBLY_ACC=CAM_ASM_000838 /TAXON_ID=420259 /ORGANISM="Thalassiosira gravida, Strain GMp14c1" /LENGTH=115 /DNA_ID=CAMNT_0048101905 /DNA_START=49 /DNA_END=392 /DNA_ORIENTATION=+